MHSSLPPILKTRTIVPELNALFLGLVAVGFFQSFSDSLRSIFSFLPPPSLWGPLKFGIILLMLGICFLRWLFGKEIRLNKGMLTWSVIWFINWLILVLLFSEGIFLNTHISPLKTIQSFGMGNMIMVLVVYLFARPSSLFAFLKVLVWAGIAAALFGITQSLLGPQFLAAHGIDVYSPTRFSFLDSVNPESGHHDFTNGFRAFSFFSSHHAFSAFLVFSIVALHILYKTRKVNRIFYFISSLCMWSGMAITYNLTNIFTCIFILLLTEYFQSIQNYKISFQFIFKRKFWRNLISIVMLCIIVISPFESVRNRFLGIFDYSPISAGAGGSLFSRTIFIKNGLDALAENPMGLGLYHGYNKAGTGAPGYTRENFFEENDLVFSADAYFLWLLVQIGLPCFLLYFLLMAYPVFWALKERRRLRDSHLRITFFSLLSITMVTILMGVSNSPILVFPPSNLLIWSAIGIMLKIPSWDFNITQNILKNENCR